MSHSEPETGRHAAPDDDPNSDPPPVAGEGGDHRADSPAEEGDDGDEEPASVSTQGAQQFTRQPGALRQ